jgi:class 3 adenylate cyclase/tetratricopeptide (TPR) repeat protein
MSAQCRNCGFVNPPNMRFCGNCGHRLLTTGSLPEIDRASEDESSERIGELVGADLLDRFRQAGLEAAGQRRQVTVLFVDLSGYTHLSEQIGDSEEIYELVQRCTKMFANNVYKFDGMVDKFMGDGLMALFGAPIAHENSAELAIRAALDMQTDLEAISAEMKSRLGTEIRAHIGLHSGSVVVGGIGSNMMMNYTAIGDVVNLASRIEAAAEAGVTLVSEAVYRQVRTLFNFEPRPALQLKGISRPVITYRVLSPKSNPGSVRGIEGLYAPMVGRDGELERLRQTVSAMITDNLGRFVAVSGEAGLGKSRLISEFKAFLSQLPVQVEEGYSLIYRKGISYWIFQDVLLRSMDVDADTSKEECQLRLRERVTRALPNRAEAVLPYLEHMLSLPLSNPESAKLINYLAADQLRQQIFLAMRDLILADAQQKPVVLILEDLHWADAGSLGQLDFLLDSLSSHPLVIVSVSRSFSDGELAQITQKASDILRRRFTDLALKSLSPDQSDRLFSQLLSIRNLPEMMRNHIIQRASGIPLYLEEILRMLMDRNLLQRLDGHWQFVEQVDLELLGVPDTLEGLILTRFDHLDLVERHILKIASVIGRAFTRVIIVDCLPSLMTDEINRSLRVLLEREFILPDPSPGGEYIFKHVLVSDTIYSTLLKSERKELHGRVARIIEKLFADNLENHIDVLARHYFWSDQIDRALRYLILAGEKASRNYNTGQAQKYFEDALTLLPEVEHTPQQALQVHSGLGDALVLTGDYPAARAAYQLAVQAITDTEYEDAEVVCSLKRKIGMTHERQGDYALALTCLGEATDVLASSGLDSPAELSQILNDTGWIYFRRSDLDDAEKFLLQAQALAEKAVRLDLVSSVYNRLGGVYYQKDSLKQASDFVAKSLAIREEIGDILGVARSYNNLGNLARRLGAWDEALDNFKRSAELQARLGDKEAIVMLNGNLGLLQIDRGYLDEARKYLEEALVQAEQIGHNSQIAISNQNLSLLYSTLGEWSSALEYSCRSETIFKSLGEKADLADVYVNQGVIYLGLREPQKAAHCAEQALALLAEFAPNQEIDVKATALRLLGDTHLAARDIESAQELYQQAERIFASSGNRLELGRLQVRLARLAALQPNREVTLVCISKAKDLFQQLGARLDLQKLETFSRDLLPED